MQSLYQYHALIKHLTDTLNAVCEVEKPSSKKRPKSSATPVSSPFGSIGGHAGTTANLSGSSGGVPPTNSSTNETSALEGRNALVYAYTSAWLGQRSKPDGGEEDWRSRKEPQDEKPYNFFAFDEITEMQNGKLLPKPY